MTLANQKITKIRKYPNTPTTQLIQNICKQLLLKNIVCYATD